MKRAFSIKQKGVTVSLDDNPLKNLTQCLDVVADDYRRCYKLLPLCLVLITVAAQAVAGMCGKAVISKRHYSFLLHTLLLKAQGA